MRSSKNVLLASLSCVLSLASVARPAAQDKPDFSGSWILQDPQQPAADVPKALRVRQPLTRTNVRGEPMMPFYRELTVEKLFENEARTETYHIGVQGYSAGVVGDGRPISRLESHSSVLWEGDRLRIEITNYGPSPEWFTEHTEVWSFDKNGRLSIALVDRQLGSDTASRTLTYRRQ